jgi:SAM-dependent methyltransferase
MDPPGRSLAHLRGPFAGSDAHSDAPWWQTPPGLVDFMLDLAEVGPGDRLIDLGCGDGRIAIAAARRGAEALGIERDPGLFAAAEGAARAAGLEARARFRREDLFATSLAGASVVTLYLLPHLHRWLAPRLLAEPAPGARILAHAFPAGLPGEAEHPWEGRLVYLTRLE